MINKISTFITEDIWRIRAKQLSSGKSLLIRSLRILLLSIKEFSTDKCHLRASALTFYSLLSIVPIFAMAFGVAKGFGLEKMLEEKLLGSIQGQEEVIQRVIGFSNSLLENTRGGLIAGIGIVLLFWTVIKMLGNIEKSFNDIWGIRIGRSWIRKFSDYLSLMLICPIMLIFSGSLTVLISTQVMNITSKLYLVSDFLGPVIFGVLKLLPYAVFWALLTFLYSFMPNAKIRFSSAVAGGVVAGTLYQLVQWGYIYFQVGVSKYGAIYGSFAALPLFLLWLQISWLIVLYGAEIAFAHQNEETYEFEPDCSKTSRKIKKVVALKICQLSFKRFDRGEPPLQATDIAHALDVPIRLIRELLYDLVEAEVLNEVREEKSKAHFYQPAHSIENSTIQDVLEALDKSGKMDTPFTQTQEFDNLKKCIENLGAEARAGSSNKILKNFD